MGSQGASNAACDVFYSAMMFGKRWGTNMEEHKETGTSNS